MKRQLKHVAVALLAAGAAAFAAPAASADPIGAPWSASGTIQLDSALGTSSCTIRFQGFTDGDTIDSVAYTSCSGFISTLQALLPWTVTWNGSNTGGTIQVRKIANMFGYFCLYEGAVPFAYATGTWTIGSGTVRRTGQPVAICPTNLSVRGLLS